MESNILKFPSPIAACVVNGLMSGLPLDEIPTETKYCLVYATKPVINQQTPIEWWTIASNYVLFGAIPNGIDQIENAVVGYVEVSPSTANSHSFVCCEGEPICRFSKCHAFDTPIKASLESLTNEMVDLLIDTEPSHSYQGHFMPIVIGGSFHMPLNEKAFYSLDTLLEVDVELTKPVALAVLDENDELQPFELLFATCAGMIKYFTVKGTIITEINDKNELVLYPSTLQQCGRDIHRTLHLEVSPIKRLR